MDDNYFDVSEMLDFVYGNDDVDDNDEREREREERRLRERYGEPRKVKRKKRLAA
jgi:hypothetical protein